MLPSYISSKVRLVSAALLLLVMHTTTFAKGGQGKLDDSHKYMSPKYPVDERVHDLLSRMTIEEKVAQMMTLQANKTAWFDPKGVFQIKLAKSFLKDSPGQIVGLGEIKGAKESALIANQIQKFVIEHSRLGIPLFIGNEMLHSHKAKDATIFPLPIGLASSWNEELIGEVYKTIAIEAKSRGTHQGYGPNLDIARDLRWGNFSTTFGEDPYLVSKLGVAAIKELQGNGAQLRVLATAMHFGANGANDGGHNGGPAEMSDRMFREIFLPPFKAAIKEAKVGGLMVAFNELSGIPMHANRSILYDLLRRELNYDGIIVSSRRGISELVTHHFMAVDQYQAAKLAINANIDLEMPDSNSYENLIKLVKSKEIPELLINKAVTRILKAKFLLGLFENPYVDPVYAEQTVGCQNHRYVSLKAASESIILLKNENKLLPLDKKYLKSIAVIGPNANRCLLGEYSEKPLNKVTVLEGIKAKVSKETEVYYAEGCRITKEGEGFKSDTAKMVGMDINEDLIKKAVEAASRAEVILLVLGSNDQINRNTKSNKHLGDHAGLDLPGDQNALVKELLKIGKPIIVYLMNSNPLTLNYINDRSNAILEGWYAGQETGTAVADIIFGDVNPSARMPITVPRNANQLPSFYNHKPMANLGYAFEESTALYPFGFGLSYTTFSYEAPLLNKPKIKADGKALVSIKVTNTGKMKGSEVVQLYIRDEISSVTRPIKELKAFKKVTLMPGESNLVEFEIGPNELSFYDLNMSYGVEKGKFQLMSGPNAEELKMITLEVE